MSPLKLKILLHCYASPAPYEGENPKLVASMLEELEADGLVASYQSTDHAYSCTDKGTAHIFQILALEFPERVWVGQNKQIIEMPFNA